MGLFRRKCECAQITFVQMPPREWRIEVKQASLDGPYAWISKVFRPGVPGYCSHHYAPTREKVVSLAEDTLRRLKFEDAARNAPPEVLYR